MKQRFSSLDIKVIAQELSHDLCSLRLSNVYDLSSRIFLLKFAKPDCRRSLLIDVGFRCHLTDFVRATASAPSQFVVRMRKFLRSRRVTSVAQVGTDRILEFQFSDGQFRLFLEFYAGGNIILTNQDLSIIALFRIVSKGLNQEELRMGLKYSLDNRQNVNGLPDLTVERVKTGLQEALDRSSSGTAVPTRKFRRKPGDALRKAIVGVFSEYPPALLDHTLRIAHFDVLTPVEDVVGNERILHELFQALNEAQRINEDSTRSDFGKGYIIAKAQRNTSTQPPEEQSHSYLNNRRQGLIYEDFQPFRPLQYEEDPTVKILEFDGFNKTVDEFFSSIESQRLESRISEREDHARRKLENARQDHEVRLDGLQKVQQLNVRKAHAIEGHLQRVEEAISAVNSLVAQSIGWPEIARLIEMEQQRKNPVAEMIKLPLKLHENTITLLLTEVDFQDEADFEGNETDSDVPDSHDEDSNLSNPQLVTNLEDKRLAVEVDLELSPWANARQYYDQKKTAADKEQRTIQSSEKALKNTERKINADLKKGLMQEKEILRPQRNAYWFEKFIHFISSEGYLVLAGKDAQQSEIIYRKHLAKGDIYVHADLQGAASTIIKNKPGKSDDPIPPSTLSQAGNLAVCTSSAWDSKAVMSAWWVHAKQVSKTNEVGDFLPAGTFLINGDKNFLPPAQLLLGVGLMFKISEDSKLRHFKHRFTVDPESASKLMLESNDTADFQDLGSEGSSDHPEKAEESGDQTVSNSRDHEYENRSKEVSSGIHYDGDTSQDAYVNRISFYYPIQTNRMQHEASHRVLPDAVSVCSGDGVSKDGAEVVKGDAVGEKDLMSNEVGPELTETANSDAQNSSRPVFAPERRILHMEQQRVGSEKQSKSSAPAMSESKLIAPKEGISREAISQPQVRGKRGKRYKMKTKYADQDEEERALAMRLLGSTSAHRKAQEDIEANAIKEERQAVEREKRRKQHTRMVERGKEAEERRQRLLQEGLGAVEDEEAEIVEDLEAFIGAALPGDEILDALTVCGPWDAIGSRCRWKAKLQPGSVKKGKAVKEILEAWSASLKSREKKKQPNSEGSIEDMVEEDKVRIREAELIRAIREPEMIGAVPVTRVRLMMGAIEIGSKPRGGGAAGRGKRGGKGSKRK